MPIDIYQIKELFGDNNSYEVPNTIPTIFEDKIEGLRKTPTINGYFSGTIKLTGGHGNGAKYAGDYYILKKLTPLQKNEDVKKQIGLYTMVKCMGCNHILKNTVHVKGDLACGNLDEDLRKHINKCSGGIERPADIYRLPLGEQKEKIIEIKKIERVEQKVIGIRRGQYFKELANNLKGFKNATDIFYKGRKDIYIFSFLDYDIHTKGGQVRIKDVINDALDKINNKEEGRILVNVTTPNANNKLLGHIALSYETNGIGSKISNRYFKKIDLSGVKEIKRVRGQNLEAVIPDTPLTEDNAIFSLEDIIQKEVTTDKPGKLSRKFYSPISYRERDGYYYAGDTPYGNNQYLRLGKHGPGQKIQYYDNYNNLREGYFYGLDRLDFVLNGYEKDFNTSSSDALYNGFSNNYQRLYTEYRTYLVIDKDPIAKYLNGLTKYSGGYSQGYSSPGGFQINRVGARAIPSTSITQSSDDVEKKAIGELRKNDEGKIPGYGVLIGQHEKDYGEGQRVEYTGSDAKTKIYGYSGINKYEFYERYYSNKGGYANIENLGEGRLGELCKDAAISKFFLDLDNFLGLYFTPKIAYSEGTSYYYTPTLYYDEYDLDKILNLTTGIANETVLYGGTVAEIKGYGEPPYKDNTRFVTHQNERHAKIQNTLIRSEINLKKDFGENNDLTIEKGDFFITDLEYDGNPGTKDIGNDNIDVYKGLEEIDNYTLRDHNLLEDFVNWEYSTPRIIGPSGGTIKYEEGRTGFEIKHKQFSFGKEVEDRQLKDNKAYCICSNYKGEVEIREIRQGTYQHELSQAESQAIRTVDGQTTRTIKYGLLKKGEYSINFRELKEEEIRSNKEKLLTLLYKALGYSIFSKQQDKQILTYGDGLTKEQEDSEDGNLFDLVGSDGYAYIRKNKVHFIYKHRQAPEDLLGKEEEKINGIDEDGIPQKLKDADLEAKINQINIIYYKSYATHIKSRFLFNAPKGSDEETKLEISYKAIDTKNKPTTEEYYFLNIRGEGDQIETTISIPKEPADIQLVGDRITYEQLKLSQQREYEKYELQQQRLGLEQKLINISAERAEWDLSMNSIFKSMNLAMTTAGVAGGLAIKGSTFAGQHLANYLLAQIDNPIQDSKFTFKEKAAMGALTAIPKIKSGIRQLGFTGGALSGDITSIADQALYFSTIAPERARRIQENKTNQSEALAIKTMEIDRSHFSELQDQIIRLNNLANQYYREGVNDTYIYQEGKKEKLKGKKAKGQGEYEDKDFATDAYMLTLIPSEKQLSYIKEHRKQFGVHCDIPNMLITFRNGMKANIIQMRNIDEKGILGIEDVVARSGFKARLLNKIKIVENEGAGMQLDYTDHHIITPIIVDSSMSLDKIKKLEGNLENVKIINFEAVKKIIDSIKTDKDDLNTIEQDIATLKRLKADIEAHNANPEVAGGRKAPYDPAIIKLINEMSDLFDKVAGKQKNITDLENKKQEAEGKIQSLQGDVEALKNVEKQLEKEKQKSKEDIETLNNVIASIRQNLSEKDQEIRRVRGNNAKLIKERDALQKNVVIVANQNREIENLKAEIKTCEEAKKEAQQQYQHLLQVNLKGVEAAKDLKNKYTISDAGTHTQTTYTGPLETGDDLKGFSDGLDLDLQQKQAMLADLNRELAEKKEELKGKEGQIETLQEQNTQLASSSRRRARSVQDGTLNDVTEKLMELKFDVGKFVRFILKENHGGLNRNEGKIQIIKLHFYGQILEDTGKLLDDNTSFMLQDNDQLRNELISNPHLIHCLENAFFQVGIEALLTFRNNIKPLQTFSVEEKKQDLILELFDHHYKILEQYKNYPGITNDSRNLPQIFLRLIDIGYFGGHIINDNYYTEDYTNIRRQIVAPVGIFLVLIGSQESGIDSDLILHSGQHLANIKMTSENGVHYVGMRREGGIGSRESKQIKGFGTFYGGYIIHHIVLLSKLYKDGQYQDRLNSSNIYNIINNLNISNIKIYRLIALSNNSGRDNTNLKSNIQIKNLLFNYFKLTENLDDEAAKTKSREGIETNMKDSPLARMAMADFKNFL